MVKSWPVQIAGLVSQSDGNRRVAVPNGEYVLKETDPMSEEYEISSGSYPTFFLTLNEVAQYAQDGHIKIDGDWP
jgi:hypothetical protein